MMSKDNLQHIYLSIANIFIYFMINNQKIKKNIWKIQNKTTST